MLFDIRDYATNEPPEIEALRQFPASDGGMALKNYLAALQDMLDEATLTKIGNLTAIQAQAKRQVYAVGAEGEDGVARTERTLQHGIAGFIHATGDGYDFIETNRKLGWKPIPAWGRDGWDMGRWPALIVMTNDDFTHPRMLVYIEGDVDVTEFDSATDRDAALNEVAERFWRAGESDGPKDIAAFRNGQLPDRYRGRPLTHPITGVATPAPTLTENPEIRPNLR